MKPQYRASELGRERKLAGIQVCFSNRSRGSPASSQIPAGKFDQDLIIFSEGPRHAFMVDSATIERLGMPPIDSPILFVSRLPLRQS